MKYVALLRGINVGGHKKVPMADLRSAMEKDGFEDVRTLLASGNVVFSSDEKGDALRKHLETLIEKRFGFEVPVILRKCTDIETLVASNPFADVSVDAHTRLYVTFLSEEPTSTLRIPHTSAGKEFTILTIQDQAICSVLQLSPDNRTTEAMHILEKEFGKNITTRNWNTVVKIVQL